MNKLTMIALAAMAIGSMSACAPTMRLVTAEDWHGDGHAYLTYWQNTGKRGESKVELCHISKDNSLGCRNQADAEAALNVKGRKKGK